MWLLACLVCTVADISKWLNWSPNVTGSQILAPKFESTTPFSPYTPDCTDKCQLSSTTPNPAEQVCDCGSQGVRWARMQLTDDLVQKITGAPPVNTDRCEYVSLGWTWNESPENTQDIVMTMDPGGVQTVQLAGSKTQFLGNNARVRGQPCGIVYPDVFQGTPMYNENESVHIFPGSIPVSDYCLYSYQPSGHVEPTTVEPSFQDGIAWQEDWSSIMIEGLGAVDAVCRCALGRVGAMLEMSGVFFTNPAFTENITAGTGISTTTVLSARANAIYEAYQWRETPQYVTPLIFYCREDYVLYWNLMLAYEAIYNVSSPLHPIWLDSHTRATGEQNALYWRRFYSLGVDCLANIPIDAVDNPCLMMNGGTAPFLVNVGVILDIGQLFRSFDLVTWCNVSAEIHVTTDCARDYIWAFVSAKRRGTPWTSVSSIFESEVIPFNVSYNYSLPITSRPAVFPANIDPISNMYEYAMESASLFVRIVAYSDVEEWSVNIFDIGDNIPTMLGTECTESMVSGEVRNGPPRTFTNITQRGPAIPKCGSNCNNQGVHIDNCALSPNLCENTVYENNYSYCTWNEADGPTTKRQYQSCGYLDYTNNPISNGQNCPNAYPIYTKTYNTTTITGYCVTGSAPQVTYECDNCGSCKHGDASTTGKWLNCNDPLSIDTCSMNISNPPSEIGSSHFLYYALPNRAYVCGNSFSYTAGSQKNTYSGYCFAGPDALSLRTQNLYYYYWVSSSDCGKIVESCGAPVSITVNSNWVGERYIPVFGNPRMRGMMPRSFYNMSDGDCDCTTSTSICFNSGLSNYCTMYMPRPATASIFARGSSPIHLDYRAVFFDPMLEDLFAEASASPPPPFVSKPETGQFNGASAVYGNTSYFGYGGPLYAQSFCNNSSSADFCIGLQGEYSLRFLTTDEFTSYNSVTTHGFAGVLANYYSALVGRSSDNVGPWLDTYFHSELPVITFSPVITGTSVDLCFLYGWCTMLSVYVPTIIDTAFVPLYSFAQLKKPTFDGTNEARAAFFSKPDYTETYSSSAGGWKGDPTIPFYKWNNYQAGVPFGWGEYKPLLQQVLTWGDATYSFSNQFTNERRMYGSAITTRPKAAWCWKSGRGFVNDLQAANLGMCITDESCYQSFTLTTQITGELGCITNFNATGWSQVNVIGNMVQWGVPVTNTHTTQCYELPSSRICIMPPGQNPPSFRNENFLVLSTNVSAENTENTLLSVTAATCGCDPSNFDTIDSPTWMCRVNSITSTNGNCYIRTNSTCDDGDFNCGTQFSDPAFYNLCQYCPTIGVPTVGQCKGSICLGLLNNGSCPAGSALCTVTRNSYAAGQGSLFDAGLGVDYLWFNGSTHDFFDNMPSMMSTITADRPVPDPVHCIGLQGPNNNYATVEKPKYLRGNTVLNDGPGSLTEEALDAWCGAGDCTGNRQWLCVDKGQSIFTSTQQCRLRRSWVSTFYRYKNAQGKNVNYYGDTSSAQLMPDCAAWVSGIDDDSMCQNDAFTGCVITRVGQHIASMGDLSGDIFRGSIPTETWVPFATSDQDSYASCKNVCLQTAKCIAWFYNASCTLYNETDWSLDTGSVSTTVGSAFPITAGFFVPRTNAGPVYEILAGDVLTTYPVTGIDLFTASNGITIKFSEYNTTGCFGTFYYYGGSPVMLRSTPVTSCSILSNISAYTTPLHTFPAKPLIVRVNFSEVFVVGLLSEDNEFNANIYTDGVTGDTMNGKGRGLRGALRSNDGPFKVILSNNMTSVPAQTTPAGWIFGDGQPAVVSASVMRTLRRICVPITVRQTVNVNTLAAQAEQYNIIRTDPVDCIVAGSNENNVYVNSNLYGNNGICAGDQDLQWPGQDNNVAKLSTLNSFSWWSWVTAESHYPAPIFYDPTATETNAVNGQIVTGAPNCGQNAETCLLAYDIIGYTPCTDVTSSIWFTCMKPTMMALFPLYDPDFSYELSTPFLYPDDLYVTVNSTSQLNADDKWSQRQWSQYITMVHYCDRYMYDDQNQDEHDTADTNGWKPGKFVACDNDPFTNDQRVEFCRTKQPWWVITGLVFTQFSINDLCPFLSGSANKYCFIFADHPMYSTVGALLSASIGQEWDETTFYYVPYTLKAMGYILFNPHVVNTLISNNMFTQGEPILEDKYGPAAAQFINNGANLCVGQLTPDSVMSIYNVLQSHYDPGTDTYTFGLTSESTDSTVTVSAQPPIFSETSALIQYNGLTLVGLGPPAKIGSSATTVVNQIRVCTRFQIDGSDINISNFIFDQSKCYLTGAAQQTPIVFSGAFGSNVVIYDITVIDSSVAVAVLGGDSLVYTYVPIIDIDGLLIYNISFQYTTSAQPGEQYTLAVLGRSTGVPTIAYCSFKPPDYTVLPNCVLVADIPEAGHPDCAMPNECIYDKNGCCGRNSQPRRTFGCEYGLTCTGNRTDIDNWYKYQPNARILCNQQATGCNTGVEDCIKLQGENCYYNRTCSILAAEDIIYLSTPSGNSDTSFVLSPIQSWQYYTPGDWYFVPSYPSARNPPSINYVDGVGFGNLVWTIQGNESRFPTDFQVHALPIGTEPSGLSAITIIPQFKLNLDSIAQDTTKLVLMTEWYISQRNLNTTFVDLVTKEWCVGVNGSRIMVLPCDNENTDWYFDKHSGSLHISNYPHMCATSLSGPLYWLPCLACHVGLENTLLSDTQQNKTQLFYNNTAVTSQGLVPVPAVNYSLLIVRVLDTLGYILDESYNCLTFDSYTTTWEPCHPNYMFPYNRNVCTNVGILRYICTQGYGGSILEASLVDSTCEFDTATAIGNGFGATLSLVNGVIQVVHSGDGYMNGEIVQAGPCNVVVYTPKVLVQPLGTNFSLASAGVEVVNVAELTDVLDAVYEADAVIANMTLDSTVDVITILLAILVLILMTILIAACWYKQLLIVKEKTE